MQLNRDDIVAICPPPRSRSKRIIWDAYVSALTSPEAGRLLESYGVTTPLRVQHLLATFAAETNFALIWESGIYRASVLYATFRAGRHSARVTRAEAERLCAITGQIRTPYGELASAKEYAIFERVYGLGNPKKAKALGNTLPGDGYRYRGCGLIQTTGKFAHMTVAKEIGCRVEDLAKPINALHAALIEWDERNCERYADRDDVISIRKLINAGTLKASVARINGLPEARRALAIAKRVITPEDFNSPPAANVAGSDEPPPSMVQSTEAQAATATGGTGGYTLYQGTQTAVQKAAGTGDLSFGNVLMCLLAEPLVWAGVVAIGGAVYWFFKRRKRLYFDGV